MFTLLTEIFVQQEGLTPLHYAAIGGNSDVVKILIKAGSRIVEKENVSII